MTLLGAPDARSGALMRAALQPADLALIAWRYWVSAGVDPWTDPMALRWLPLVGWNLRDAPVDDRSRAWFQRARHGMWAANVRLLSAAAPAVNALAAAGIPVILLKGASLATTVYENSALRPIGDVDILVPPDRAVAALHLLGDRGWHPPRRVGWRDLLFSHGLNLLNAPHGALDLHWYLLTECCTSGADDGLWRRARRLESDRLTALVLSPADQLLHVCLHGLAWTAVRTHHWVADAVHVIRHAGPTLDWEVLVEEARRRRLALQMAEALRLVRQISGAPVPDAVLRSLDAERATWRDRLECRFKSRPAASLGGLFLIWCNRSRLSRGTGERAPAPLSYLAVSVGLASRRDLLPWAIDRARARASSILRARSRAAGPPAERPVEAPRHSC
jgi:hypothetical protein